MFRHHIHVLGTQNTADQLRLKSLTLCEIQANFLHTATKNELVKLNPSLRRRKRRKIFGQRRREVMTGRRTDKQNFLL